MSKFNFDFMNVADLPEEIQKKFTDEVSENSKNLAMILEDPDCPGPLNITQLMAVYARAFGPLPTMATFRAWLNKGVAAGIIGKPTKQTYGPAAGGVAAGAEEDAAEVEAPAAPEDMNLDADPLEL